MVPGLMVPDATTQWRRSSRCRRRRARPRDRAASARETSAKETSARTSAIRASAGSAEAPASACTGAIKEPVQGVRRLRPLPAPAPGRASRACVQGRLAQPNKKRHAGRPRVVFSARARLFIASEDSRGVRHRGDASIRVVQCCSRLGGLRGTLFAATICVHAEVYREAPLIMCNEVC
jgi:hypothetical protein